MASVLKSFASSLKSCSPLAKPYGLSKEYDFLVQSLNYNPDINLTLLICGEFKRGKSSLINALLNDNICPVADGIATAAVCILKFGVSPKVTRYYSAMDAEQASLIVRSETIDVTSIEQYAKGTSNEIDNTLYLEIELPNDILKRLTLIDTPGIGSLDPRHLFLTLQAIPKADAIFFVTDVSEPMLMTELDFIKDHIYPTGKPFDIILNKSDMVDREQCQTYVLDVERKLYDACGITAKCIPVSSTEWIEYNQTGKERRKENSHCECVLTAIKEMYPRHEKQYEEFVRNRYLQFLTSVKAEVEKSINELSIDNLESQKEAYKSQLEELRRLHAMIVNDASPFRTAIQSIIDNSQEQVSEDFSRESVLLSTEKLENILQNEKVSSDEGSYFVVRELNSEINRISEKFDRIIDAAIDDVLAEMKEYIEEFSVSQQGFSSRINFEFEPVQHSFAENFIKMTRQALPVVGVASIGCGTIAVGAALLGTTATILAPVVGISAGIYYLVQTIKGTKKSEKIQEIRKKVGPQITIVVNEMRAYVQKRYTLLNKEVVKVLKSVAESMTEKIQEKVNEIQAFELDVKKKAVKRQELQGNLTMLNNIIVQTRVADTNPFAKQ